MGEAPGEQYGQEFPKLRYVLYHDGEEYHVAAVLQDIGDTRLRMFNFDSGQIVEAPHHEPSGDEKPNELGVTWRYPK